MNYFHGCTALITGASSGIGRELAWQLAPDAHALVLVARRMDRLEKLKAELCKDFPSLNVFIYGLDLRDANSTDEFLQWLGKNNLRVNFLVNNAGLGDYGDFASGEWEKIESMIAVNVTALTRLTHRLLPTLRSFEAASILNVSSIAGFMPIPQIAVYAATKAYVTSFSEALRIELRDTGVSVTTLCPGPTSTEFGEVAKRRPDYERVSPPEFFKVPVEQVARQALDAVARDNARVIPGWKVALGVGIIGLIPIVILRMFLASWNKSQEERH
jgi:short-subunit dehydrogenase